jgi:hypothetical protein
MTAFAELDAHNRKKFLAWGSAQPYEKSRFGQENPRESKEYQTFFLEIPLFFIAPARLRRVN